LEITDWKVKKGKLPSSKFFNQLIPIEEKREGEVLPAIDY
jgi:hypothetical protein